MPHRQASDFIDAMHRLEEQTELGPLLDLFDNDAELTNPVLHKPLRGLDSVREFFRAYRHTFRNIRSDFRLALASDQGAVLELRSRGHWPDGRKVDYEGVIVLEFRNGKIGRFHAYFDPRVLGSELEYHRVA